MATRTKTKRPTKAQRALLEWSASAPAGSPLKVDRDKRVIYGVRVIGRFSRNSHGLAEATGGTEYTRACMEQALALYEGAEVLDGHEQPGVKRANGGNDDVVGVLRNARLEGAGADECVRADLHYFGTHRRTAQVLEDVECGLGVYGLSHDARAGRERFDPAARRLVIESLANVKSVDLVRKPATNRNLWEAVQPMSTTLRQLLESRRPKWSKPRRKWADRLLEDDALAPAMDAPAELADGGDEDDALWNGFKAAIDKLFEKYSSGELDEKAVGKQVVEYLKAHKKLTGDDEPEEPVKEGAEDDDNADKKKADSDKTESVKETAALKHKLAVRELADDLGIRGDKVLLETAERLPDLASARRLFERERARGGAPRSGGFAPGGSAASKAPADAAEFANSIRD